MISSPLEIFSPARVHVSLHQMSDAYTYSYGGFGFFLQDIGWRLKAKQANDTEILGNVENELRQLGICFLQELKHKLDGPDCTIEVKKSIPLHCGFGAKTSFLCGILFAYCKLTDQLNKLTKLIKLTNRGGVSGIGINSINSGGFILDTGQKKDNTVTWAPSGSVCNNAIPNIISSWKMPDWYVLLALPNTPKGMYGNDELQFFKRNLPLEKTDVLELAGLVLFELLPGISSSDFEVFCKALLKLQTIGFKKKEWEVQSELTHKTANILYDEGVQMVGLSSMGPLLYSIFQSNKSDAERIVVNIEKSGVKLKMLRLTKIENKSLIELNS